jgi:hypothetical protein
MRNMESCRQGAYLRRVLFDISYRGSLEFPWLVFVVEYCVERVRRGAKKEEGVSDAA